MSEKDRFLLERLVRYCEQIDEACTMFGKDSRLFASSTVYQNACCMCILQIGELAGRLSDDTTAEMPDIPWRQVRGMRNLFAHNYGALDTSTVWETIETDIPALRKACMRQLES